MAEYYLISQLPSLDGISESTPLPITEERFVELCDRCLGKKALYKIENLTLVPPLNCEKASSGLIDAWNDGEQNLRLALAKARAGKMNQAFDLQNKSLPLEALKAAGEAVEIESPLEAEIFLLNYRLRFLEDLRPADGFSEEFIYYYGLKLKLLWRVRQFNTALGKDEYRKIYDSILNGDKLEDIQ